MAATPTPERLLQLVRAMAGRPIAVAADLVADRFITGSPKRISREAPVLILSFESERVVPGGGANAVANVAALGGRPLALGAIGEDPSGRQLVAGLEELGVATSGILTRAGWHTPTKTRILGGGRSGVKQQIVRYDIEENLELTGGDLARFRDFLCRAEERPAVGLISDYGYGSATPALVPLLRAELASGATLLADSRYRLAEFAGLDGATPNEEEAEALLGHRLSDRAAEASASGQALRERLGMRFLLITRGSRGMMLAVEEGTALIPVHGTDQVADVTGAGDTVIGSFALALAAGASPLEAALLANYAGGVVVMKMGTATLSRAELAEAIEKDPLPLEEMQWVAC
ncbi:MAG: PfkB family carbohydrate kinase [Thermoanaerobaculia bacterium]